MLRLRIFFRLRVHVIAGLIPKGESYENVEKTYLNNLQFAADKLAEVFAAVEIIKRAQRLIGSIDVKVY